MAVVKSLATVHRGYGIHFFYSLNFREIPKLIFIDVLIFVIDIWCMTVLLMFLYF